jgi:hypothetical protein
MRIDVMAVDLQLVFCKKKKKQDRQCRYKVALKLIHETIVAVKKQYVLHIGLCVQACACVRACVRACVHVVTQARGRVHAHTCI